MAKVKTIPKSYHPSSLEVEAYMFCVKELKIYFSIEHTNGGFNIVRGTLNNELQANKDFSYKRIDLLKPDKRGNRIVLDKMSAEREVFRSYLEMYNHKKK